MQLAMGLPESALEKAARQREFGAGLAQEQLGQGLQRTLGSPVAMGVTAHAVGHGHQHGGARGPMARAVFVALP